VSLFPLVILTHLVERFWTVEAEDSTAASFKTLLGRSSVTIVISLALSWEGSPSGCSATRRRWASCWQPSSSSGVIRLTGYLNCTASTTWWRRSPCQEEAMNWLARYRRLWALASWR